MGEYFSYGRQTAHYFDRPHESLPTALVVGEDAWRGIDLAGRDDWRYVLSGAEISELLQALGHATATGRDFETLTSDDFPLERLSGRIEAWRRELVSGRGFLLVSGVPVDDLSRDEVERLFWCLGLHMGSPGAQNTHGDTLGHVVDTGEDAADPFVRLYRTSSNIAYHCDAADVVALLCLQTAKEGGASRIVSSVAVFNELLTRRPDLCARFFDPFLLDIRDENAGGLRHIAVPPCRFAAGRLRTFYHSDYFRSVVRHDDVTLTHEECELMDLYEEIARDPRFYLDMHLARGDIQWISNHSILHARTEYEDFPEPERKRHLLRLWLSIA
jgi:hypothetical protein